MQGFLLMQNSLMGSREQGGRTAGGGGDMVLLSSCLQVHGTDICDSNSVWTPDLGEMPTEKRPEYWLVKSSFLGKPECWVISCDPCLTDEE